MKHQEDTNEKVLFLTLDRGAKTIARSVGLPLAEFDITEFFNLKNTQTTARAKPKKKSKPYKRKRQNPIAILFNAIVQLIRGLFGLFVLTFVIFVVVNLIADNRDYKEQTKAFNHIEGDQNTVSIQVIGAKNDKDENTYEIKLEVMNQTSKKINWNRVATPRKKRRIHSFERTIGGY